jgi:predicted metal-dependent hydrolase
MSYKEAEQIVCSKVNWIRKHLDRMKELEDRFGGFSDPAAEISRAEARKKLVDRLDRLSGLHGFSYNKVSIRNQKTRWGSCSAKNNISLNMKLLRLPEELIDYVIIHELVHTKIKNHSEEFWLALERILGNAKALNARLNEYQVALSL